MSRALREALAVEAARIMLEDGVKEYYTAKHLAADYLLGGRRTRVSLPSNREIRAAIVRLTSLHGETKRRRLRHLREVALQVMEVLDVFEPRLIGSVASGAIHAASDVDLHVFSANVEQVEHTLHLAGWTFERIEREIIKSGECRRYVHIHLEVDGAPVELSVYDPAERFVVSLSSIDGKPIERVPPGRIRSWLGDPP